MPVVRGGDFLFSPITRHSAKINGGKYYDERIKVHKTIFQSSRNFNEVDEENPH